MGAALMIHYHGGPITPETCARRVWSGRHAFISYAEQRQIALAASVCQSFAIDNGAFSFWRSGTPKESWWDYYRWADEWLAHPACDWAIIPDVIGGTEAENDLLVGEWPHGHRGVPVWHLNESVERLVRLAAEWPRVALGSADEWDVKRPRKCLERLGQVLPHISRDDQPLVKLHGLRMLNPAIVQYAPLASADSTNVARNIGIDCAWRGTYTPATKETRADVLVERIEQTQAPDRLLLVPEPDEMTLWETS